MIFVECNPDYALVKSIMNIPEIEIIHAGGKSIVCKNLENKKNCKGMVDEDPRSPDPPYMKNLHPENDLPEHDLIRLRDNPNDNHIIVLRPRLEEWILEAANDANVDVRKYNLPNTANRLHRLINVNLENFESLLEELKRRNPERLQQLKGLLEE